MKKKIIIISIIILVIVSLVVSLYFILTPTIKLNGSKNIEVEVFGEYVELGATSKLFNKDYTDKISISGSVNTEKLGKYKIKYSIKLKYLKKEKTIARIVSVVDNIPPTLELLGNKDISLYVGDVYKEYGYNASDNYDEEIPFVEITNNIDNTKEGEYEVIYVIRDSSGNEASDIRKVTFKARPNLSPSSSSVGVPILMYHFFYDETIETGKDANYMSIQSFDAQMKYLQDNDYYFPTWSELRDFVDGKIDLPSKSVMVTIDDGNPTFFNLALPVINKYNVKATSFIITTREGGRIFKENLSPNIIYETHTHTMHQGGCSEGHGGLFMCISHDAGVADINTSCEILGSCDAIAYPFGDVNENVLSIIKDTPIKVGVTTEYGKARRGMDPYQLPRVRMSRGMSLESFIASL